MSEPSLLRVLYVTDRWDGPYRYRCQHGAEQLRADGIVANVAHVEDPALPSTLESYGVVVLFRLPWGGAVERVVRAARVAKIPLFFDIDDLTFDPAFESLMPFRRRYSAEEWARTYGRQMIGLRRTFDACDAFLGSTPELVEQAQRLGKLAYLHPNVVPGHHLRKGRLGPRIRGALRSPPTIGYFSGSDTHDEDFASVAGALARVLRERRDARLLVVGHLSFGGTHPEIEARALHLPYMHHREFAYAYGACHVTLAPLAAINAFTNSKSALKFFEAGAFFTPTIATPVREMAAAITDGEDGFLARSEDEWVRALLVALTPGVSERTGARARERVERIHSARAVRGALSRILSRHAAPPRGPAPELSPLEPLDESGSRRALDRAIRPGRMVRDLFRIARVAQRAPISSDIDAGAVERWLDSLEGASDAELGRLGRAQGVELLVAGSALRTFRASADVDRSGELPGELRSRGRDPSLTSAELAIDTATARYLVLRLRAFAETPARAQIFWKSGESATFAEESSTTFAVSTDGVDRTYVVDLHAESVAGRWKRHRTVTHLRLDPLDRPGSFRLAALALLASAPEAPDAGEAPRAPDAAGVPRQTTLELSGSPAEIRFELSERVRDTHDVVRRVQARGDGRFDVVLAPGAGTHRPGVDIVVPVYNAKDLVLRCIASAALHAHGDFRIVVVDDASTDRELTRELDRLASEDPLIVLLRNERNLGFVGTANRGIRHAGGRDVLLLNSDTEVFEGFLDRLRDAAYSDDRAGMVSPLSNNATICSVPDFCRNNALPDGITRAEMAELVARASDRSRPELVTPHGFCLYLRSDFVADVGVFDEERFGRGFGEENDLGERAKAAGWRTLLADDVYVWHAGKGSFGDEGRDLERRNEGALLEKHPGYRAAVARFVEANPLSSVQQRVRRHLRRRSHRVEPSPLFVLHASPFGENPGGVEHCVRDLVSALRLPRVVLAYPADFALEIAEVIEGDLDSALFYRIPLGTMPGRFCHEHPETLHAFETLLSLFRIAWVHVHHLMFLPLALGRLFAERRLPYVVTVHDFYPACPSYNLLDVRTTTACCSASCHREQALGCQRALFAHLGEPLDADPLAFVDRHRNAFRTLLSGARAVVFPSASAARYVSRLLDLGATFGQVLPHGYDAPKATPRTTATPAPNGVSREPLRVALVGQIAYAAKGAEAYLKTMDLCAGASMEWHVFGQTDLFGFDERLSALGPRVRVVRHGAYARDTIVGRLRAARVDVGLLLPAWPETYSYTLTEMLAAGVPVVARRIGALGDRLEGTAHGRLVDGAEAAAVELSRLATDRNAVRAMALAIPAEAGTADWARAHRDIYGRCEDGPVAPARPASPSEYRRLNELSSVKRAVLDDAVTVTRPSPAVTGAWWFQYAERVKPYVPESVRHVVRRSLSRDGSRAVLRFRLPGPAATLGRDLTVTQRYVGTTQLTSHGVDPFLVLGHDPIDPRSVRLVRFNLWCSTPTEVFAQLYWRHEGAAEFDEEHSLTIPLNGRAGAWQEYVARLDGTRGARGWYEGGPVVALRFDPINVPGPIGLGELALCDVPRPVP